MSRTKQDLDYHNDERPEGFVEGYEDWRRAFPSEITDEDLIAMAAQDAEYQRKLAEEQE